MRIAVTTDDGESVASRFGRCKAFLILDAGNGEIRFVESRPNRHTPHAEGQCGRHAEGAAHSHERVIALIGDCQALISGGIGWRAAADLEARGIRPFVAAAPCGAAHAVSLLLTGLLKPAAESACHGHHAT